MTMPLELKLGGRKAAACRAFARSAPGGCGASVTQCLTLFKSSVLVSGCTLAALCTQMAWLISLLRGTSTTQPMHSLALTAAGHWHSLNSRSPAAERCSNLCELSSGRSWWVELLAVGHRM